MARKLFGVVAAVALASGAMFALVGPASAQTGLNTLNIQKSVGGTVPSGTVFSVQVSCTEAAEPRTVWFDDTGHASDSSGHRRSAAPVIHAVGNRRRARSPRRTAAVRRPSATPVPQVAGPPVTTCNGNNEVDYGDTDHWRGHHYRHQHLQRDHHHDQRRRLRRRSPRFRRHDDRCPQAGSQAGRGTSALHRLIVIRSA